MTWSWSSITHRLLRIVRAHLDGVRAASAGLLGEQLVVLRPLVHHPAVAIEDVDHVLEATFPAAFRRRLAGGAQAVGIRLGVPAGGIERRVRRPRFGPVG